MSANLNFLKTLKSDFDKASTEKAEQIDVLSSTSTDTVVDLKALKAQKADALKMARHFNGLIKEQEKKEKEAEKSQNATSIKDEEQQQEDLKSQNVISRKDEVDIPSSPNSPSTSVSASDVFYPKGWDTWGDKRKQSEAKKVKNPELLRKKRPNHAFFVEGYLGTTTAPTSSLDKAPGSFAVLGPVAEFWKDYQVGLEDDEAREQRLIQKRASLQVHEEGMKKFLELGFTKEDLDGCMSPDELRQKMLASKLSPEYIDRVFPNLDDFYFAQYDLMDLRFEELKLKLKKEFQSKPMKLYRRLNPEFIARLEKGESPEIIAQELHDAGVDIYATKSASAKAHKELKEAGFSDGDILNPKETRRKVAKDPVYRQRAQQFVNQKNAKRKAQGKKLMPMSSRVFNVSMELAALPVVLSMDIVKSLTIPILRPKKKYKNSMKDTADLLKTMASFANGTF